MLFVLIALNFQEARKRATATEESHENNFNFQKSSTKHIDKWDLSIQKQNVASKLQMNRFAFQCTSVFGTFCDSRRGMDLGNYLIFTNAREHDLSHHRHLELCTRCTDICIAGYATIDFSIDQRKVCRSNSSSVSSNQTVFAKIISNFQIQWFIRCINKWWREFYTKLFQNDLFWYGYIKHC